MTKFNFNADPSPSLLSAGCDGNPQPKNFLWRTTEELEEPNAIQPQHAAMLHSCVPILVTKCIYKNLTCKERQNITAN